MVARWVSCLWAARWDLRERVADGSLRIDYREEYLEGRTTLGLGSSGRKEMSIFWRLLE